MGDDDDFVMERIRKNERFRRLEEERRQERLRKATLGGMTTTTAIETTMTLTTTTMTKMNDDVNNDVNDGKEITKDQETSNHNARTITSNNNNNNNNVPSPPPVLKSNKNNIIKGVSFLEQQHHYPLLPKGINGYIHSMTTSLSPSSSVTMSQPTPPDTKQKPQQQQQLLLLQSNVHKNSDKASNNNNLKPPPPVARKKISTLLDSSSEEEDANHLKCIMEWAQRSEDQKEKVTTHPNNSSNGKSSSSSHKVEHHIVAKSPTAKRKLLSFNSDDDDDEDNVNDILAIAQRIDEKKRDLSTSSNKTTTTTTSQDSSSDRVNARKRNCPRNPFTLMKEEEMYYETMNQNYNNNISKSKDSRILTSSRNSLSETNTKNLLWSDGSDEDDNRDNQRLSITTTKKRKSNNPNNSPAKNNNNNTANRKSLHRLVNNDEIDNEDEDDRHKRLHPHFDHPKFGPYNPPVPFVLRSVDCSEKDNVDCSTNDDVDRSTNDDVDHVIHNNNNNKHNMVDKHHHYQVPASINRYLPDYQRTGIEFMYRCGIESKGGAILGDDMGLGKTVQTISLLAALYRKTGTDLDVNDLKRRRKLVETRIEQTQRDKERALMEGRIHRNDGITSDFLKDLSLPQWSPVLIIAPNAVVTNWVEDFKTWAHFSVAVYQGAERASALERIENGFAEVLVCGDSTIQGVDSFTALDSAKVTWKIIVVDEFHKFKNETKHLATNLRRMRDRHGCVVLGLTGTLMQNNHKELWNLVDIVAKDFLGPWLQFEEEYAKPIQLSRTKDASAQAVELGDRKAVELSTRLQRVYLRRTKEDTLADILPTKDERIIFCELSNLQKDLYKYIIEQPDYIVLRHKNAPCDCGVNMKFFLEYQHLRSKEDRIEYQRKNRDKITTRGQCCYKFPKAPNSGGVDPDAVLWRQQHVDDRPCSKCPSCTLFGAMSILYKLCSHAALLQVKTPPERLVPGSSQHTEALRQLDRARCFIPPHLLAEVPGGYYFENSIMDNHAALSGKMAVLDKLLQAINAQQGRVLLFAHSTKTLDLIESYIQSTGMYSYLRMDGQTANAKRKEIADKFRASSETFVFLLSTKAMGLGLNLTQANFVIMFDVDWNPSSDSQAQDRAYRIGQERDVKVFRLVARGTIEEQKYLRQVYKTQLKSETIVDVKNLERRKSSRLFRGVAGDENRKGELFGSENLLKFKDGTFMNYASRMVESRRYGVGVYDTHDLLDTVKDLTEEELNDIGQDVNMFGDIAKCTQANDSECDEEINLGGMSQAVMEVCEQVDGTCRPNIHEVPIPEEIEHEIDMERSNETQSPLHDALTGPKEWKNEVPLCDGKDKVCRVTNTGLSDRLTISNHAVKKLTTRNTKVAGKTSDQIRRGELGPTTFKVSDLFVPGTNKRR